MLLGDSHCTAGENLLLTEEYRSETPYESGEDESINETVLLSFRCGNKNCNEHKSEGDKHLLRHDVFSLVGVADK